MTGGVLNVQKVSGVSGSEAHLLSVLPALRARGWDARMLVLHEGEPGAAEFAERLRARGVPVRTLRLRRDLDPAAFAALVRAIRAERPRIVHTHLVHADLYALPAARLAGVRLAVSTKHGFNAFRTSRALALADRAVARLAAVNVAISRGLARYLASTEGFDADAFRVVHYGIEAGPEPPPAAEPTRLAAIGRLLAVKGLDVLLDALAEARRTLPALTLELAGEGPLRAELEARAARLGLGESVRLLGRVTPVGPLIERSAAVVVPSRGEGFGLVALEAMERGRAVVASSVGGLPELVEDGVTGLLVPADDPRALAAALVELGSDLERVRALGAAGRERALATFGADRPAEALDRLYRELLER